MRRFVLPRTIKANRGDLASRWSLLDALSRKGINDSIVFVRTTEDVPKHVKNSILYGYLHNAFPSIKGWKELCKSDVVLWGVGLDMQDDSSLMKLIYLLVLFRLYRLLDLEIWVLFQGAGPIETKPGRYLAKQVLKCVSVFAARDTKTLALVKSLSPQSTTYLGHDAIFFAGLEDNLEEVSDTEQRWLSGLFKEEAMFVGFNIRQWFHFSSSILPYQFSKQQYQTRSQRKMQELLIASCKTIRFLRDEYDANVLLISAYQPEIEPWEDDLQWLELLKRNFLNDDNVVLIDKSLSMPAYYKLMSHLDLAVGMRLHTALIALRLEVPAINVSYTLKGESILSHLGLPEYALGLNSYIENPTILQEKISAVLENWESVREDVSNAALSAINLNESVLDQILSSHLLM